MTTDKRGNHENDLRSFLVNLNNTKVLFNYRVKTEIKIPDTDIVNKVFEIDYKTKLKRNSFLALAGPNAYVGKFLPYQQVFRFFSNLVDEAILGDNSYEEYKEFEPWGTAKTYNRCYKAKRDLHDAGIHHHQELSNILRREEGIQGEWVEEIFDYSQFDISLCQFGDVIRNSPYAEKVYFTKLQFEPESYLKKENKCGM